MGAATATGTGTATVNGAAMESARAVADRRWVRPPPCAPAPRACPSRQPSLRQAACGTGPPHAVQRTCHHPRSAVCRDSRAMDEGGAFAVRGAVARPVASVAAVETAAVLVAARTLAPVTTPAPEIGGIAPLRARRSVSEESHEAAPRPTSWFAAAAASSGHVLSRRVRALPTEKRLEEPPPPTGRSPASAAATDEDASVSTATVPSVRRCRWRVHAPVPVLATVVAALGDVERVAAAACGDGAHRVAGAFDAQDLAIEVVLVQRAHGIVRVALAVKADEAERALELDRTRSRPPGAGGARA